MNFSDFGISRSQILAEIDPHLPAPESHTAAQHASILVHVSGRDWEAACNTAALTLVDIRHDDPRRKHWRDVTMMLLAACEEPTLLPERTV